jgi:hypothetical protein
MVRAEAPVNPVNWTQTSEFELNPLFSRLQPSARRVRVEKDCASVVNRFAAA